MNEMVNRAITYIIQHIGENLTIDDVAEHCHFSKYYFSRVFKEETGESIYSFIKRAKMDQSAFRLKVDRDRKVTDIGYDYGYSPSNYSSVFRQQHNVSPAVFRRGIEERSWSHPFYPKAAVERETFEECNKKVSIVTIEDQFVIYERKIGNYYDLGKEWSAFLTKYQAYQTEQSMLIERTFDDPSITDVDKCLYDICMSVGKDCTLENTCVIQGGKFAVYHFKGYPRQIYTAYQMMFQVWLPQSKHRIDKRYGFEQYLEVNCDDMYMVSDIYIPIE